VSEVGDLLNNWANTNAKDYLIFDYAINEIVALEEAIGAAWSGLRSAVIFKHLGMNIVADALHSIMYSGIDRKNGAGLVIICGGDPQSSSSTNAMDVRLYSLHTKLPILFPSSIQELYKFTKIAFQLSECLGLPVMIYTTSKLSFTTGIIEPNSIRLIDRNDKKPKENVDKIKFIRDFHRYINAIHYAINNQKKLNQKIEKLKTWKFKNNKEKLTNQLDKILTELVAYHEEKEVHQGGRNQEISENKTSTAIITGGLVYLYVYEFLSENNLLDTIPILKINILYPINSYSVVKFIEMFMPKKIIVIEELEPFIENRVKNILYDHRIMVPILGKSIFPLEESLNPQIIKTVLRKQLNLELDTSSEDGYSVDHLSDRNEDVFNDFDIEFQKVLKKIPIREPTFCAGCSHRNVFYALRRITNILKEKSNLDVVFGGDIGCYTMGMSPPYSAMDWLISMGAGIGIANGVGRALASLGDDTQRVVALIGDSTFFHSGIQGLLNILKNNLGVTIIILNNYYVAMTGHQPTLTSLVAETCSDENIGFQNHQFPIEQFLRNMGAESVISLNGYDLPKMMNSFEKIIGKNVPSKQGTKIIVINSECALMQRRKAKVKWNKPRGEQRGSEVFLKISDSCPQCNVCFVDYGCPAIKYMSDDERGYRYIIDEGACLKEHCKSCIDVCPNHCIETIVINPNIEEKVEKKRGNEDI
ncbi:MAG: hypothetical protein GF364_19840, partial [Candidatus Lokiarchaeota archaeon]|nr:hypothetical protein [Candidatus Lokiarchaeota archaeon]